jgi:hypothetical protein
MKGGAVSKTDVRSITGGPLDTASLQDTPVPTSEAEVKELAIKAGNEALAETPEMMAAKQAAEMIGMNKEFSKATDVGTYANMVPETGMGIPDDKTIEEDLGWINYYRKMLRDATSPKGENSYFNFDKQKEQLMNNFLVKTSKTLIENKIVGLTQSMAEMMNLVEQGENVADLDSKELDERVANLNKLLQDPKMKEQIAETARSVTDSAKEPLKDMTKQLTELAGEFTNDMSEQGTQIAVTALGAIPGPGNVLSILNAAKKTTDLITDVADNANKAMDIGSKTAKEIGENLEKAEKEAENHAEDVSAGGGAKKIKSRINESKQVLKRVNKSLKEHFHKLKNNMTSNNRRNKSYKSNKSDKSNKSNNSKKKRESIKSLKTRKT